MGDGVRAKRWRGAHGVHALACFGAGQPAGGRKGFDCLPIRPVWETNLFAIFLLQPRGRLARVFAALFLPLRASAVSDAPLPRMRAVFTGCAFFLRSRLVGSRLEHFAIATRRAADHEPSTARWRSPMLLRCGPRTTRGPGSMYALPARPKQVS